MLNDTIKTNVYIQVHLNIEHKISDLKLHQKSNQMQQAWVAFVSFPTNHVYEVCVIKHVCKSSESVSCRWKVFPSAARFEYRNRRSSFNFTLNFDIYSTHAKKRSDPAMSMRQMAAHCHFPAC